MSVWLYLVHKNKPPEIAFKGFAFTMLANQDSNLE